MVTVKFFGMVRIQSNIKSIDVSEGNLAEVIDEIVIKCPQVDKRNLQHSIIMLNNVQLKGIRRLKHKLKAGDELVFLSPASGG